MPNELKPMKAWLVKDKDEYYATVVFAETRGKARALAMHTDACEDVDFCDIEVRRKPQIDKYSNVRARGRWIGTISKTVLRLSRNADSNALIWR